LAPDEDPSGETLRYRKEEPEDDGHVVVAVRCRPMSEKELASGYESIVEFESSRRVVVQDVGENPSEKLGTRTSERANIAHVYEFDLVFDHKSSQAEVYEKACRPIVASALQGYNGTILAYGQTGTGKTFTMEGSSDMGGSGPARSKRKGSLARRRSRGSISKSREASVEETSKGTVGANLDNEEQGNLDQNAGIIPRSFGQIFQHVAENPDTQFLIRASYLEIYEEQIRDLLRGDKTSQRLELHERPDTGVYVKDLTSFVCKSMGEMERVMRVGNQNRIVGATDMNEHSSRSHAIFMITIEQQQLKQQTGQDGGKRGEKMDFPSSAGHSEASRVLRGAASAGVRSAKSSKSSDFSKRVIRVGKLNLVDLAGSERQSKTNSFGQRQRESIKINLSLSALGNVINSLMKMQLKQKQQQQQEQQQSNNSAINTHTPYRDSKLTRLLQDSLGGNAKTLMIANIGPASYNHDETISTLNYASRARCIKNRPQLNEDPKDALLRQLQHEIDLLRMRLAHSSNDHHKTLASTTTTQPLVRNSKQTLSAAQPLIVDQKSANGSSGGQINRARHSSVEIELQQIRKKLSSLEGKLLNGYTSVDQKLLKGLTQEQENELNRKRDELESQANRQKAISDELERRIEIELEARQSFETIQQEVESKRRLIKQILLKIKTLRDDIDNAQQSFRIEIEELEQLHGALQKELKLKRLIMDNFVPNLHVDQLLPRIRYDEQRNVCTIKPLTRPMGSVGASRRDGCGFDRAQDAGDTLWDYWRPTYDSVRPKSEFERMSDAIYPNNIRYKYEHIFEPILERVSYVKPRARQSESRASK